MCVKVAGNVSAPSGPPPQVAQDFYRALALTEAAVRDNLYRGEFSEPAPAPTKEIKPSWPPAPELILEDDH